MHLPLSCLISTNWDTQLHLHCRYFKMRRPISACATCYLVSSSLQSEYCYPCCYRCLAVEAIFSCWNILWYSDRTLLSSVRSVYGVLPLHLPAVCWHLWACVVSDCAIRKLLEVPRGLISLQQGHEKYSLYLIFAFYLNRDTSMIQLFPVMFKKRFSVWPHWMITETVSKNVRLQ